MAVRVMGSDGSATRSPTSAACVAEPTATQGVRAFALCSALVRMAFVGYVAVVTLSVLGLRPLGARSFAGLILLAALGAAAWPLRTWPAATPVVEPRGLARVGRFAMVTGLTATATSTTLALLLPVGAYDALGYRLAAVAQWLDAGAVTWVAGDDPLRNGYPLGLEVLEALVFRTLDTPAAIDALSTGFVLAGALALQGLVRGLGGPRWAGELALGLFLLVPMQLLNAPSGYADAAFAGALVTLLVLAARWRDEARASWLDLGMTAALVTALKPHGFALAAIALAAGMLGRLQRVGMGPACRELAKVALVASSGLFFAVRNVVVTGNPIYPLELRIGDRVLLAGESSLDGILTPSFNVPAELARLPGLLRPLWVWLQPHGPARSFDERLAGFGYAFALLGLPALVWAVAQLRHARVARTPRALGTVLGASIACFLVQPLSFWPRFTTWLWGAAALALALWLGEIAQRGRAGVALAMSVAALALAVPEALYALAHVKRLEQFGLTLLRDEPTTALAKVAGVNLDFVRRALLGKRDVCRTPWRLGTDDANLDGVVAQLSPRPRMHVVDETSWSKLPESVRAQGCDALIVIGDSPLIAAAPPAHASRIERATAFGPCHLVSLSSPEVSP